jgi:hypothetical protein
MTEHREDDLYDDVPDHVLRINDKILSAVQGEKTADIIMSLMSTLSEVMIRTAPSKASALETAAGIALSIVASIHECDHQGICNWNDRLQ